MFYAYDFNFANASFAAETSYFQIFHEGSWQLHTFSVFLLSLEKW